MRFRVPDLHRANVHVFLVLFETESAIGKGNDANDDKNNPDDARRFHVKSDKRTICRVARRRD
jgi:hypothetical protein